jgi:hypothetical protein
MDKMHTELTTAIENFNYSPALKAALSLGKSVLDKYYSLSDDSEIYRIAMGKYNIIHSNYCQSNYIISPTSEAQTQVFREAELGRELG